MKKTPHMTVSLLQFCNKKGYMNKVCYADPWAYEAYLIEEVLVHGVLYPPDLVQAAAGIGGLVDLPVRGQEGSVLGLEVCSLDVRRRVAVKELALWGENTTTTTTTHKWSLTLSGGGRGAKLTICCSSTRLFRTPKNPWLEITQQEYE